MTGDERLEQMCSRLERNSDVSDRTRRAIAKVLLRLPRWVARFVVRECFFYSIGNAAGSAAGLTVGANHVSGFKTWVIILSDEAAAEDEQGLALIAHELAHAWLRQESTYSTIYDDEFDASSQARDWGFIGLNADPERYPGPDPTGWMRRPADPDGPLPEPPTSTGEHQLGRSLEDGS